MEKASKAIALAVVGSGAVLLGFNAFRRPTPRTYHDTPAAYRSGNQDFGPGAGGPTTQSYSGSGHGGTHRGFVGGGVYTGSRGNWRGGTGYSGSSGSSGSPGSSGYTGSSDSSSHTSSGSHSGTSRGGFGSSSSSSSSGRSSGS